MSPQMRLNHIVLAFPPCRNCVLNTGAVFKIKIISVYTRLLVLSEVLLCVKKEEKRQHFHRTINCQQLFTIIFSYFSWGRSWGEGRTAGPSYSPRRKRGRSWGGGRTAGPSYSPRRKRGRSWGGGRTAGPSYSPRRKRGRSWGGGRTAGPSYTHLWGRTEEVMVEGELQDLAIPTLEEERKKLGWRENCRT